MTFHASPAKALLAALLFASVTIAGTATAEKATAGEDSTKGPPKYEKCSIGYQGFLVDDDRVQSEVPASFTIWRNPESKAALLVKTYFCEGLEYSTVGVRVLPPDRDDSGALIHSYTLWNLTDNANLFSGRRSLGAKNAYMFEDAAFTVTPTGAVTQKLDVNVPWNGDASDASPYSYSIDHAGVGVPLPAYRWTFWESGSRGIVRMIFVESVINHNGTTGKLQTEGGSRLAGYLDATSAEAGVAEAKFDGTVTIKELARWAPGPGS